MHSELKETWWIRSQLDRIEAYQKRILELLEGHGGWSPGPEIPNWLEMSRTIERRKDGKRAGDAADH